MVTVATILANVRVVGGDPDADFMTDAIGFEWLSMGQERFCHEVLALDEIKDYPLVARQKRYDVPSDFHVAMSALYWKNASKKLMWAEPAECEEYEVYHPLTTGTPRSYSVIRRQVVIGPAAPLADSATTTGSGDFSVTATTIGFTAASGTIRTRGWLVNATTGEVIEYTNVSTTTVTGCTRGVHNTTAATAASGQQWKEIDLQLRYRRSPTAITASTQSPEIAAPFHRYLEHWVLYRLWLARGDKAKADAAYTQFEQEEKRAKDSVGRRAFEMKGIKSRRQGLRGEWTWGDGM